MVKLKPLKDVSTPPRPKAISVNVSNELTSLDFTVLGALIGTATESPNGYSISTIKNRLKNQSTRVDLSIIKLEKLGYIDRRNETDDQYEYEYFAYTLTTDGIELLINNENKAFGTSTDAKVDDGFDDDIPF